MLIYLDQARSIGPNSTMAQEARRHRPGRAIGLDANLARELLELHTLGGAHSQADVQALERAVAGRTVGDPRPLRAAAPLVGTIGVLPYAAEAGRRPCDGTRYPA